MTSGDGPQGNSGDTEAGALAGVAPAELLGLLWANMTEVLGNAATATLLRRAAPGAPALAGVAIHRTAFDYQYSLPNAWEEKGNEHALRGLRSLCQELRLLLVEMTGPVMVRRLERIPALRQLGMTLEEET